MDIDYRAKYLKYKSKYLTLKNSHKMVGGGENDEKPRVIFFKLYGCGPCNRFKPVWDKLATEENETKLGVEFKIITNKDETKSAEDNEKLKAEFDKVTDEFRINSFPTIMFEKNRNQFNGDNRTVETLVEWIKHNKQI